MYMNRLSAITNRASHKLLIRAFTHLRLFTANQMHNHRQDDKCSHYRKSHPAGFRPYRPYTTKASHPCSNAHKHVPYNPSDPTGHIPSQQLFLVHKQIKAKIGDGKQGHSEYGSRHCQPELCPTCPDKRCQHPHSWCKTAQPIRPAPRSHRKHLTNYEAIN